MKFSKLFYIFKDEKLSDQDHFVFFDEFYEHVHKTDGSLKKYNVKRSFQRQNSLKTSDEKEVITVSSIIHYCFQQQTSSVTCKNIARQIENELLYGKNENPSSYVSSTLDLYKLICKTSLSESLLFEQIQFDEQSVKTLLTDHKPCFKLDEWRKIVWFENHFSKSHETDDLGYEEILRLKYAKFQSILSFKECSSVWSKLSSQSIRDKFKRFELSDEQNKAEIVADKRHLPFIIDDDLKSMIEGLTGENVIQHVVSFDITSSVERNVIQVVIALSDNVIPNEVQDLCSQVFYSVKRRHGVNVDKILFIPKEELSDYTKENIVSRFHLRDVIETKRLQSVIYSWDGEALYDDSDRCDTAEACETCFSITETKPLTSRSFDLIHEWYMELPIETQILFESFINKDSLRRCKDPEKLFRQKLENLYCIYDSLLNVKNKHFVGIFQRNKSKELLIGYKSVKSVFNITSSAGATTSLSTAEDKLKDEATDDLLYYNTFLKHHELVYNTVADGTKTSTNLRQCHLILMLDNLVRWHHADDVRPGQADTDQMCTLPITIQGLPLDSKITDEWHLPECDGSLNCVCKHPETLNNEAIKRILFEPQDREGTLFKSFTRLMTWGRLQLWRKMPDEIFKHLESESTTDVEQMSSSVDAIEGSDDLEVNQTADELNEDEEVNLEQVIHSIKDYENENDDEQNLYEQEFSDEDSDAELEKSMDNLSILEKGISEHMDDLSCSMSNIENKSHVTENKTFEQMSVDEETDSLISMDDKETPEYSSESIRKLLSSFGFKKFIVPPLLCRHPPPAMGRDDDISKIREIVDDVLMKMGYVADDTKMANRILCGPDNKIGKCLLSLMETNRLYKVILPEFPLLHLRKSKITVLFGAYKDAGIVQILKYMRDEKKEDWTTLVSIQHIDRATRYVKRISLSLHLAFLVSFAQSLDDENLAEFLNSMESEDEDVISKNWGEKYEQFLEHGAKQNATFCLHLDMMRHCDDVIAIALAERLGGLDGYQLMLAAVKHSLLFSFVNGATSYAPFCVKLLYHHYSAGYFHRCMKQALFSTPIKSSTRNFSTDTKREMDHLDVLKGFPSGSTVSSVSVRMSLIDSLNQSAHTGKESQKPVLDDDKLGWEINDVDESHVFPTAGLILRRKGISLEECNTPINVYTQKPIILPTSILDECSLDVGKFLLMRYMAKERLFNITEKDIPSNSSINAPQELVSRAKRSKGITLRRTLKSKLKPSKTDKEMKEEKRKKTVEKETKVLDSLSSANNACQALLKPDSSKRKVFKSLGMQRALKSLTCLCLDDTTTGANCSQYMQLCLDYIPKQIYSTISICSIEFAGFKFKQGKIKSGKEYMQAAEVFLSSFVSHSPVISKIIVCEEKYSFTPDDLKASTRLQRTSHKDSDIDHLKSGARVLSESCFNKDVLTKTDTGKRLVSTYLAQNVHCMKFNNNITIIVDSELNINSCSCLNACSCSRYCTPVECFFDNSIEDKCPVARPLTTVKQCKGDAEMSVADWLVALQDELADGTSAVCFVTSGDIDAVYIHLYIVSKFWKRTVEGKFKNQLLVILQKKGPKYDVYNITAMVELFESTFRDRNIGMKVAFCLCMGGNDFIPKCDQYSHDTVLKTVLQTPVYRDHLFQFEESCVTVNKDRFVDLYRRMYCPVKFRNTNIPYDEVRTMTIGKRMDPAKKTGYSTADPKKWLPPKSAIGKLCDLVQLQIKYLETAGIHDEPLPNFLESGCLTKSEAGEIEYDFGPDAHFESINDLPDMSSLPQRKLKRQRVGTTPRSGERQKRVLTSTPTHRSMN